jgi:broad specificity phosphatase PhoE
MRRLLLVRHGSTDAVRAAAFGTDEPLDDHGREGAGRLR